MKERTGIYGIWLITGAIFYTGGHPYVGLFFAVLSALVIFFGEDK